MKTHPTTRDNVRVAAMTSPKLPESLADYIRREVGGWWVCARKSKRLFRKYPGAAFISHQRYAKLSEQHRTPLAEVKKGE